MTDDTWLVAPHVLHPVPKKRAALHGRGDRVGSVRGNRDTQRTVQRRPAHCHPSTLYCVDVAAPLCIELQPRGWGRRRQRCRLQLHNPKRADQCMLVISTRRYDIYHSKYLLNVPVAVDRSTAGVSGSTARLQHAACRP